jgi:hypothetical protein
MGGNLEKLEERVEGHHRIAQRTENMVESVHEYLLQRSAG